MSVNVKGGVTLFENIKNWVADKKKKFNKPELLTKVFYGMTVLVILNRIISLIIALSGKCVELSSKELYRSLFWHAEEYTLAFLLPLAGFAYFCASEYAADTNNKVKGYFITYGCLAAICFVMLAQWSNELIVFLCSYYKDGEILRIGLY